MKYKEAALGRVFVVRLENGDVIHEEIEQLALAEGIKAASVIIVGGADTGSCLVVGPKNGRAEKIEPVINCLEGVHEIAGVGTIFPDDTGAPVLHMHAACGREHHTVTGCVRSGVKTWHVLEAIITEIQGSNARRMPDQTTGFKLLQP